MNKLIKNLLKLLTITETLKYQSYPLFYLNLQNFVYFENKNLKVISKRLENSTEISIRTLENSKITTQQLKFI